MYSFTRFTTFTRNVIKMLGAHTLLQQNRASLQLILSYEYKKKTAEKILGIERPKKPTPPFFKFMTHMKPALLAKKPEMTVPEAHKWGGKHWRELDVETKSQMSQEYEKEKECYKIKMEQYEASLTEEQKAGIRQVKDQLRVKKKKKKIKEESFLLGKPKRPPSAYLLFIQMNKLRYKGKWGKELQVQAKGEWNSLSEEARSQLEREAQDLLHKYKKENEEWKQKVLSIGRIDLVPSNTKSLLDKQPKKINSVNKPIKSSNVKYNDTPNKN